MPLPCLPNALVPSRCLLCEGSVRGLKPLCPGCEAGLPWNDPACRYCALPLPPATAHCAHCLVQPPLFAGSLCAFRYEPPVDGLLNRYKHRGQLGSGHWLAQALADAVARQHRVTGEPLPDGIVPVPLHWRRLQRRGFDQALETGKVLARRLGLPLLAGLRRVHYTASQQGQGRAERQRNLEGAFTWRDQGNRLAGRHIALVDDVLTTGATAGEITRVLQAAGAGRVTVWAIARTP